MIDFVYPYYAAGAKGNELRTSIKSVESNFQGDTRITLIGDKPDWFSGQHIPVPRVKSQDHRAFRDTLNKLLFATNSNIIGEQFVWMMDDVYFIKPVSIEELDKGRYQWGKNRYQLDSWNPSNKWLSLKKKTMISLNDYGIETVMDYATHLPHVVTKSNIKAMAKLFNIPNQIYLWEVIYGNLYKEDPEHYHGFLYRFSRPIDAETFTRRTMTAKVINHSNSAWNPAVQDMIENTIDSTPVPTIARMLDTRHPCNQRGQFVELKDNRICSMRGKQSAPIFECSHVNGLVSIEPYKVGQTETCCKRCENFKWDKPTPAPQNSTTRARAPSKPSNNRAPTITALMTAWGRPDSFVQQKAAIIDQSIRPKEIMVWQNSNSKAEFDESWFESTTRIKSDINLGVWPRFSLALNAKTEYVCIFDDDTIPGKDWFLNCVDTIKQHNGLLGTAGVIFKSPNNYKPFEFVGWRRPNEMTTRVDIVGHAWFFRRDWLTHFWSEFPPTHFSPIAGEDMHFSYMLQKSGINTYCPPHPKSQPSLWGSTRGLELGKQGPAISGGSRGWQGMRRYLQYYVQEGFRLQCHNEKATESRHAVNS